MISIEAYRSAIGAFYGTCKNASRMKKIAQNAGELVQNYGFRDVVVQLLGLAIILMITLCKIKLLLLAQAGDVESDPGPGTYNVLKTVKASSHQGDVKFGISAGLQCLCNCLFSIALSTHRRIALWTAHDLDLILTKGNEIYCILNVTGPLSIPELPTVIDFADNHFDVQMLHNEIGYIQSPNERFLTTLFGSRNDDVGDGLLLIIGGFTVGVLWTKKNYFLFDPHCRDQDGSIPNNNTGTSVLLKFSSLLQVEKYNCSTYLPLTQGTPLQYEVQFTRILKIGSETSNTLKRKSFPAMTTPDSKRKKLYREQIKNSTKHEKVKEKNRMQDRIEAFKCKISEGPFYICVCCERLHYRDSVVLYDANRYLIDVEIHTMLV